MSSLNEIMKGAQAGILDKTIVKLWHGQLRGTVGRGLGDEAPKPKQKYFQPSRVLLSRVYLVRDLQQQYCSGASHWLPRPLSGPGEKACVSHCGELCLLCSQ